MLKIREFLVLNAVDILRGNFYKRLLKTNFCDRNLEHKENLNDAKIAHFKTFT